MIQPVRSLFSAEPLGGYAIRADGFLYRRRDIVAATVAVLLFIQGVAVLKRFAPERGVAQAVPSASSAEAPLDEQAGISGDDLSISDQAPRSAPAAVAPPIDPKKIPGLVADRTGVTESSIKVVYYWKADATQNSQFLPGKTVEGAVDEGEAFRKLVEWINRHRDDAAPTFLGSRFNLHGRKLQPVVLEAGRNPTDYGATADRIIHKEKPFAAISSHGSLSAYVCPSLAEHRILNLSTYNLDWDLYRRTNGYCVPQGMPWELQVQAMTSYLQSHSKTKYEHPTLGAKERVYGFTYWEYPGLVKSAPKVIERMRQAGINIKAVKSMEADTVTAQRQAPFVLEEFRAAGVNTVIMPDGGAPLAFTHAAAANQESFDYAIWPCSGQDTTGMVRLFDQAQWARASGLSCWDREFDTDLKNDDKARRTEWYRMYREIAGEMAEPPAPTPYVALSLLGLLEGITNAGRELNDQTFYAGVQGFREFRYDAVEGRSDDLSNMLLSFDPRNGSRIADLARVRWDPTITNAGSAGPGGYRYLEGRRYRPDEQY